MMWACALTQPIAALNVRQLQRTLNAVTCSNTILCCCKPLGAHQCDVPVWVAQLHTPPTQTGSERNPSQLLREAALGVALPLVHMLPHQVPLPCPAGCLAAAVAGHAALIRHSSCVWPSAAAGCCLDGGGLAQQLLGFIVEGHAWHVNVGQLGVWWVGARGGLEGPDTEPGGLERRT